MRWFKADLHIHTVLSPCGGLDMSPVNIIRQAIEKKLDIIAITDHNSTRHCRPAMEIGEKNGIAVIAGAELNTKEEIHCLAFFENADQAEMFQLYIDANLNAIPNNPAIFGYQYIVDENENILSEVKNLLIASLTRGIEEVEREIHRLGGMCIPAHVNRMQNGLYSQLGFLPAGLEIDALEIACVHGYREFLTEHPETGQYPLIISSDAHSLEQIGSNTTDFYMEQTDLREMRLALGHQDKRMVKSI